MGPRFEPTVIIVSREEPPAVKRLTGAAAENAAKERAAKMSLMCKWGLCGGRVSIGRFRRFVGWIYIIKNQNQL